MDRQPHRFVVSDSGDIINEKLYHDHFINFLYSGVRENAPALFRIFTGKHASEMAAIINYDIPFRSKKMRHQLFEKLGIDSSECIDDFNSFKTPRQVFERKICYWSCRSIPEEECVVSPADARVVTGSFHESSILFIKDKFFNKDELLGKIFWQKIFAEGDFAIFRLTPDKYHYNHSPVSGTVVDHYEIDGRYHSCNPSAVVTILTPHSKNKRIVTIINTDVSGGSNVGMVAMIEVVALMIGRIVQRYSAQKYDNPEPVKPGLFMKAGNPKSLFRPGSSTDILVFQKNKIRFSDTIITNQMNDSIENRFTKTVSPYLVETDVKVRSLVARKK